MKILIQFSYQVSYIQQVWEKIFGSGSELRVESQIQPHIAGTGYNLSRELLLRWNVVRVGRKHHTFYPDHACRFTLVRVREDTAKAARHTAAHTRITMKTARRSTSNQGRAVRLKRSSR